jgi:hypothetical protein
MFHAGSQQAEVDEQYLGGAQASHDRLREMDALHASSAGQHRRGEA